MSNRIFTTRLSSKHRRRSIIVHSSIAFNLKLVTPSTKNKSFSYCFLKLLLSLVAFLQTRRSSWENKTYWTSFSFMDFVQRSNFRLLIKYFQDEKENVFLLFAHDMSFIDQKEFMNEMNICDIVKKYKFMLMSSYFESSCHSWL